MENFDVGFFKRVQFCQADDLLVVGANKVAILIEVYDIKAHLRLFINVGSGLVKALDLTITWTSM